MYGQGRLLLSMNLWLFGAALASAENAPVPEAIAEQREPTPVEDDAQLHDVRFVGDLIGWAVGERGVIWHSRDGGATWQLQKSGVDCALHSVCFLTDRVGWIAGGSTAPFTQMHSGVLLATTDGGATWTVSTGTLEKPIGGAAAIGESGEKPEPAGAAGRRPPSSDRRKEGNAGGFPRLHRVKFFSLKEGYVIGQASDAHPTGVLLTEDGGRTWRDAAGPPSTGWRAADFMSMEEGAVAGLQGRVSLVVKGKLAPPRIANLGARGLYDLKLLPGGKGCLVGDGGLNLWTENGGLVWQAGPTPLPEAARDLFDFRSVARRGEKVWIAGQPGSTIWHSPDAGRTWKRQSTGQRLPLSAIHFSSDSSGWAVGALGTVLRTENSGKTWTAIRGAGRRLAVMSLHSHPQQISLNMVSQLSGEGGYRSLVQLLPRADLGPEGYAATDLDARLVEAVTVAGGSGAAIGWQFPLSVPGLERDSEKLIADWNRRTEGRLVETLLGHLVRQIRMWRPSVIVLDQPTAGDALTRIVNEAVLKAVDQAADSTRFIEQQEVAALEPWRVAKVFLRLPPGSSGPVNIDPHLYLPRVGQSVQMSAAPAYGRLFAQAASNPLRESYKLLQSTLDETRIRSSPTGFFDGLLIAPGSDARRGLPAVDDDGLESRLQAARKQRNFGAYVDRFLRDRRHAGQLVGQLEDIVREMPDPQAALQMAQLAESYLSTGQWEMAELTLMELVQRYPDQPVTLQSMQYLLQSWGSAETTWRRLRQSSTEQQQLASSPGDIRQKLEQVAARLQEDELAAAEERIPSELPKNVAGGGVEPAGLRGESRTERRFTDEKIDFWQNRALQIAHRIEARAPDLHASPAVQFPLAAIFRTRGVHAKSDDVYRKQVRGDAVPGWPQAAAGELWLSNPIEQPTQAITICEFTANRPILDGVLSDDCWENASEIPLLGSASETPDPARHALAMLCYDREYLYFAATFPRAPGTRTDGKVEGGRKHDADLEDFDRVNLVLDVDRDYVTYYNLAIDQRGCVAESCWRDGSWNPRWFVAVDADKSHWRIEVAIPFDELGPRSPVKNTAWSVGIVRTIPAVGVQSWTQPAAALPRPETFGLVRFD